MLNLNLLPPYYKQEIKIRKINSQILYISILIFGIIIIFIFLLGLINLFLFIQSKKIDAKIREINRELNLKKTKEYENKIKEFNKMLGSIDEIERKKVQFSPILEKISHLIPKEIKVNSIYLNNSKEVSINGLSPKRENLLRLKQVLENSEEFTDVKIPLPNLIKPRDIEFTVSFKYKR